MVGFFGRLFGKRTGESSKGRDDSIGDEAIQLVMEFLESSGHYGLRSVTFTELFSFVYFEVNAALHRELDTLGV